MISAASSVTSRERNGSSLEITHWDTPPLEIAHTSSNQPLIFAAKRRAGRKDLPLLARIPLRRVRAIGVMTIDVLEDCTTAKTGRSCDLQSRRVSSSVMKDSVTVMRETDRVGQCMYCWLALGC